MPLRNKSRGGKDKDNKDHKAAAAAADSSVPALPKSAAPPPPKSEKPAEKVVDDSVTTAPAAAVDQAPHVSTRKKKSRKSEAAASTADSVDKKSGRLVPPIRSLDEIEKIQGQKLDALLEETEQTVVDAGGKVDKKHSSVTGQVVIKNPSEKDRVWNIDVELDNIKSTDLERSSFHHAELEPWDDPLVHSYVVKPGKAALKISESMGTASNSDVSSVSLPISQEVVARFVIVVENVHANTVNNIDLSRQIPADILKDIEIESPQIGNVSKDQGMVKWKITDLPSGEKAQLSYKSKVTATETLQHNVGELVVEYSMDSSISNAAWAMVGASCRARTALDIKEEKHPNNWLSQLRFENRSEFVVDLTSVNIADNHGIAKIDPLKEPVLNLMPYDRSNLAACTWLSPEWLNKNVEVRPAHTYDFTYSVVARMVTQSSGKLTMKDRFLLVLAAHAEKMYNALELRQHTKRDIEATITITNDGSAPINELEIRDDIPGILTPPKAKDVVITVNGNKHTCEEKNISFALEDGAQEKEMLANKEHGTGKVMVIGFTKMNEWGASINPIADENHVLEINYSIVADDPHPNERVRAPVSFTAQTEGNGPSLQFCVDDPPKLLVRTRQRMFRVGKMVEPLKVKGSYRITLIYANRGNESLKNVILEDRIPSYFRLTPGSVSVEGDPATYSDEDHPADTLREPKNIKEEHGQLVLRWFFPKLEGATEGCDESELEISFEISGDPTLPAFSPADATIFTGCEGPDKEITNDDDPGLQLSR